MADDTAFVFGAGATKACGGRLINETRPYGCEVWNDIERENFLEIADRFLVERFNVCEIAGAGLPRTIRRYALIDTAIDRKRSFRPAWSTQELVHARDALEYLIFVVLEDRLRQRGGWLPAAPAALRAATVCHLAQLRRHRQ
jgi:hypothetical protein